MTAGADEHPSTRSTVQQSSLMQVICTAVNPTARKQYPKIIATRNSKSSDLVVLVVISGDLGTQKSGRGS